MLYERIEEIKSDKSAKEDYNEEKFKEFIREISLLEKKMMIFTFKSSENCSDK